MKKTWSLFTVALFLTAVVVSYGFAQRGMNRMYDPKTVETITGQVLSVDSVSMMGGRYMGVHLSLKTDKDTTDISLGPTWYIEKQEPKFVKNDTIQVTGSRITIQGKQVVMAAQVKKGDKTLKLRDDSGMPAWGGRGRRAR